MENKTFEDSNFSDVTYRDVALQAREKLSRLISKVAGRERWGKLFTGNGLM